jgi:arylsulfatase A
MMRKINRRDCITTLAGSMLGMSTAEAAASGADAPCRTNMTRAEADSRSGAITTVAAPAGVRTADPAYPPNIIVILADDLGYGSVGSYGAKKVKTPHLDRLAREGMRFTNAHSPSSVCTPTRYNLLTGRYCWRDVPPANRQAQWEQWHRVATMPGDSWIGHVAIEANEPLLIDRARMTVASLLRSVGYATACIGKWHLGLGRPGAAGWEDGTGPDWNREVTPGPLDVGFDYFFGLPIVNSSEPKVFVENRRVVGIDASDPMRLVPGYSKFGRLEFKMEGGKAARFQQDHIDDRHTEKAVAWIEQAAAKEQPFFLYLPLSSPHWPFVPAPRYLGTSELGARGDVIQEMDGCVGDLLAALERLNIARNTLVLFASDNGAQVSSAKRYDRAEVDGELINGPLRGQKTEIYEGAVRIPFIARWPGRVAAGSENGELLALTDLIATCAAIVGRPLPPAAGEDSFSFLPALLGAKGGEGRREYLVTDSMLGVLAIHHDPWKLIAGQGHGGHYADDPNASATDAAGPAVQLYNLDDDLGETKNLCAEHPAIVARLSAQLDKIKRDGRSRPWSTSVDSK